MDGWITIGTMLSTDKFDKQIAELERKIEKENDKKIDVNTEINDAEAELQKQILAYKELEKEAENYEKQIDVLNEKLATIPVNEKGLPTANVEEWKYLTQELTGAYEGVSKIYGQMTQINAEGTKLNEKIVKLKGKQEESNNKIDEFKAKIKQVSVQKLKDGFNDVGKSVQNAAKKLGRMVLAIFGVRAAMAAISRASSNLAGYDKQYASNLEYIQYVLTQAIAPVLKWIVGLATQLLQIINTIISTLFGVNLFAKASANSFKKMKAGASGVSKSVKEIKKQLAGFDEINALTDQSSSGAGGNGGAGGVQTPDLDLAKTLKDLDVANLGKDIGEKINKALDSIPWEEIKKKAGEIGKAIADGLNDFISTVDWGLVGKTFAEGINTIIEFGYSFLSTFDWKNFGKALVDGIMGFLKNLDTAKLAKTFSEEIKGIFNTATGFLQNLDWKVIGDSLLNYIKNIDYAGIARSIFEFLGSALGSLVNLAATIGGYIADAFKGIGKYFSKEIDDAGGNIVLGILKGIGKAVIGIGKWIYDNIFKPFIDGFKKAFGIHSPSTVMEDMGKLIVDGLVLGLKDIWEKVKGIITLAVDNIKKTFSPVVKWMSDKVIKPVKDAFKTMWDNSKKGARDAWSGIKSTFSTVASFFKTTFTNAWTAVKKVFSTGGKIFDGIKEGIVTSFKTIVNAIIRGINKVVSIPFNKINSILTKIKNVKIFELKPFDFVGTISIPQIPYLKAGGIVNMPNKRKNGRRKSNGRRKW